MTDRIVKTPGPDHPIHMEKAGKSWRVIWKGLVIAESSDVLVMREAAYPPVAYFPRTDVKMEHLAGTDHHTYCPYKGEADYFSIQTGDASEANAVWTYNKPYQPVADIAGRLAFYTTKMDSIEEV